MRSTSFAAIVFGIALVAWVLYDATSVLATLRLDGIASEASVALAGLLLGFGAIALGGVSWLQARAAATA